MAVTAKTARGAARKPGGAARRHAQVVPDFQERIEHMRLLEPVLSEHRAMQAMGHELLRDDSVHCACFDCQPHAVRHQPGGMLGDINAAA